MTTSERFERDVPALLEELYLGPTPPYRNDLLRRTAATSQRPGWTFIERWIPVSAITARFAAAPRIPWRAVGLAALLLIALAAAAVYIGSQQNRVPPPFGPAANGQIPFIRNGNIYLGNPITGETRLLVGEAGDDSVPLFSPDGTRLAFVRDVEMPSGTNPMDIYVTNADGTGRRKVTPEPLWDVSWFLWAPDSRRIAIAHTVNAVNQLDLFDVSGNAPVERVAAAAGANYGQFRPPDGREILFRAPSGTKQGLFAMNGDGTNPRLLVESLDDCCNDADLGNATYTPDGKEIFYQVADPSQAPNVCCYLWVMNADGSNPHEYRPDPRAAWDGVPAVSPDGSLLAWWHRPSVGPPDGHGITVARTDGTGSLIDTGPKLTDPVGFVWAPDSSKILMCCDPDGGHALLLDPGGGPWATVPWQSDADIDWQRTVN